MSRQIVKELTYCTAGTLSGSYSSHHTHSQKMKGLTLGVPGVGVPREPTPGEGVLIHAHKATPIFELVYTCHHKKRSNV